LLRGKFFQNNNIFLKEASVREKNIEKIFEEKINKNSNNISKIRSFRTLSGWSGWNS
jgi:hypothetical protein